MQEIISVRNLSKFFRPVRAVDDLSFSVGKGEIYGFLGQNGAGKSTTIRMLLTLIAPTSGSIRIFGENIATHRRQILRNIGAIIEKPDLYTYLTALENLRAVATLSGVHPGSSELKSQLEKVGIAERSGSKVKTFSQGMKQRLGIACALVHNPDLLILDEPTNGLDPQGIADVRNLLLHLSREEKKTILVSSHLLNEIELIADSMLIIDRGKKVTEGRVKDLLNPADTLVSIETTDDAGCRDLLLQSQWGAALQTGDRLVVRMHKKEIPALTAFLVDRGVGILSVQPTHSLEEYFLSLTTANQHVATYQP